MKFKLQIMLDDEQGHTQIKDIIQLEKNNAQGYLAGLSLQESKQILKVLQQQLILHQAKMYTQSHRHCPDCKKTRRVKDYRTIQYKTLFGTVVIPSLRLYQCPCCSKSSKTISVKILVT